MTQLPQWEIIVRLLLASALGSVIGLERERLLWAAGLRTHMLVAVGSCLVVIVSAYGFSTVLGPHVILDPSRVAAQVVSGVGFLGAGSIILRNEAVKGLTTAASLWAVAGIGLAAGAGLYTAAVASTAIILLILAGLKPLEERFRASHTALDLRLSARRGEMSVGLLETALGGRAARVRQLVVRNGEDEALEDVHVVLTRVSARDTDEIIRRLLELPAIIAVSEIKA
jgi:putative Mg2+ transporter-C (MgtC) family protein